VQQLRYKIVPRELTDFHDPPVLSWETNECQITVADGIATVEMLQRYSTVEEARAVADRLLRAWEISAGLQSSSKHQLFRFEFWHHTTSEGTMQGVLCVTSSAAISVTYNAFPPPPSGFVASPDVQEMWWHWEESRSGRAQLTAMAYHCLTVLKASARGTAEAAKQFRVSRSVLDRLALLTSSVGDERSARKAGVRERRPHTIEEQLWIERVVPALIQRVGEYAFDPSQRFSELTMSEF
jgi:hypothetical protein